MDIWLRHINTGKNEHNFELAIDEGDYKKISLPSIDAVNDYSTPLSESLAWYLERYPQLPTQINTQQADSIVVELLAWGKHCFNTIFGEANPDTLNNLYACTLHICSNFASVHSLPWEAICNEQDEFIFLNSKIIRCLNSEGGPTYRRWPSKSSTINILYVLSRTIEDKVGYNELAGPFVDFIAKNNLPAKVKILRPSTFEMLKSELYKNPNFYSIVHFDGHGGYDENGSYLCFEPEDPQSESYHHVSAEVFADTMQKHDIHYVVLNACRSAKGSNSFASVAVSLLQADLYGVVAMGYTLYRSSAERFVPAFYSQFFKTGNILDATSFARQAMFNERMAIHDWLIPMVYGKSYATDTNLLMGINTSTDTGARQPNSNKIERGKLLHRLDKALIGQFNTVIIHGLKGYGKSTLAKRFVQWQETTGSIYKSFIWVDFAKFSNATQVLSYMSYLLNIDYYEVNASPNNIKKLPIIIVWDNFENSHSYKDKLILEDFPYDLYGGVARLIITSTTQEEWLGSKGRFSIAIDRLEGVKLPLVELGTGHTAEHLHILRLLSLHEKYVDTNHILQMLEYMELDISHIEACFNTLVQAGLCTRRHSTMYELHPMIQPWMRQNFYTGGFEQTAFAQIMVVIAYREINYEINSRKTIWTLFEDNFLNAFDIFAKLEPENIAVPQLLCAAAAYFYYQNRIEEAEELYIEAIQRLEELNARNLMSVPLLMLGNIAYAHRNFSIAEQHYNGAIKVAEGLHLAEDMLCLAKVCCQKAILMQTTNRLDEVYGLCKKSNNICSEIKDFHMNVQLILSNNAITLGSTEALKGNYEHAKAYLRESEKILKELGVFEYELQLADVYKQLGSVHMRCNEPEDAKLYLEEALRIYKEFDMFDFIKDTQAMLYFINVEAGEFEMAEANIITSLQIGAQSKNHLTTAGQYAQMALTYLMNDDFALAKSWALEAKAELDHCNEQEIPEDTREALDEILTIANAFLNPESDPDTVFNVIMKTFNEHDPDNPQDREEAHEWAAEQVFPLAELGHEKSREFINSYLEWRDN